MVTSLLTAVRHLSILPVGSRFRKVTEGREGEVLVFFPFAGLLLGVVPAVVLVLASLATMSQSLLPAALVVAALALVAGGANLMSLAVTADAAASGKPGAEALHDDPAERIGAAGAVAVGLALLVKFGAVAGLRLETNLFGTLVALFLAAALSRWAAVVLAAYSEYAHPEGGEDEWMVRYCGARELRWSVAPVTALAALAVIAWWAKLSTLGWPQVLLAGMSCLAVPYFASLYFERRFGGVTGRQLGAVIEIAETVILAICAMPAARLM